MHRQAWYISVAVLSNLLTDRPKSFDDLFGDPKIRAAIDDQEFSEIVEFCEKMGLTPPKR